MPFPWRSSITDPSAQPTNHLDIEVHATQNPFPFLTSHAKGLDALMAALQKWNGGVIVISHDERFITTVANEVSLVLTGCY